MSHCHSQRCKNVKHENDYVSILSQQPRIAYVDDPRGMEASLKTVWPDIGVYLDLYHALDRIAAHLHEDHSLRQLFMADVRACFLVPFLDGTHERKLVDEYAKSRSTRSQDVDFTSPHFMKYFSSKNGMW